jgi:hypothetical protein
MRIKHTLAAVAAALAMVTSVPAAPFSNGSFELTLVGDTFRYIPTDPDTTTIPGWTVYGGIFGVEQWSQSNMHLAGFPDVYATEGDQWVVFTQSPTNRISQTFDTVVVSALREASMPLWGPRPTVTTCSLQPSRPWAGTGRVRARELAASNVTSSSLPRQARPAH